MKTITPLNVHRIERIFRIVFGVVLLSLVFVGPQTWWGLLGIVPLVTGLVGSCPLYTILGIKTCRGECKTFRSSLAGKDAAA